MAKKKYNPEDVERWVTVKGARIPIMKDGTFGVGEALAGEGAKQVKQAMKSDYYSNKLSSAQLKKVNSTADTLAKQIYDEDMGERKQQELIKSTADKLKLEGHDYEVFYNGVKDKIMHLSDPSIDDDIKPQDNWEKYANKATTKQSKPTSKNEEDKKKTKTVSKTVSKNARYDTSRATKKNGATAEDIARDKETFRKAKEHEAKVKTKAQQGKQAIRDAKAALKQYGFSKRDYGFKDFDKLNEAYTKISKMFSAGEISQADYETAYNLFKSEGQYNRFFEIRNYKNKKKK